MLLDELQSVSFNLNDRQLIACMIIVRQLKSVASPLLAIKTVKLINCANSQRIEHHLSPLWKVIQYGLVNVPLSSKFHQVQLPDKVNLILDLLVAQPIFNEKAVLLQHLTDIIINDPRIVLSRDQQSLIRKQLDLWRGRKGRFEKVATVAWVISRLNLFKYHGQLYSEIAERVSNDEWYVNFDESLKALQAFTRLDDQQLKQYIYPRIERNLQVTVWETNMVYYQRITTALLQGERLQSKLWDKVEGHVLANLGMDYSLKTITDIFSCYALARQGSDVFFQMIQKAIYLGHWFNFDFKHKLLPGYNQPGEFYALLVQTYSLAKRNCDIHLLPDFLDYIYAGVADRRTNYAQLSSFSTIIQFIPGIFQREDEEEIIANLLENKKPNSFSCYQIIEFYDLMNSRLIPIPKHLQLHLEKVLLSDINKKLIPPSKVLEIAEQMLTKKYILSEQEFIEAVELCVRDGYQYLGAEERRAVKLLSQNSLFLPRETKQQLALPYRPPA